VGLSVFLLNPVQAFLRKTNAWNINWAPPPCRIPSTIVASEDTKMNKNYNNHTCPSVIIWVSCFPFSAWPFYPKVSGDLLWGPANKKKSVAMPAPQSVKTRNPVVELLVCRYCRCPEYPSAIGSLKDQIMPSMAISNPLFCPKLADGAIGAQWSHFPRSGKQGTNSGYVLLPVHAETTNVRGCLLGTGRDSKSQVKRQWPWTN